MKEAVDIHGYARKIESRRKHLVEYFKTHNGKRLLDFVDYLRAKSYSEARILKYLEMLPRIDKFFCEINGVSDFCWESSTEKQLIGLIAFVEGNKKWSPETKMTYRSIVKRFFKWLEGKDKDFPRKVRFIISHVKAKDKRMINPDELLSEDEMKSLIEACEHPRDRALVSLLCESGCRIGEALSMRIGSLKFDQYGCLATVTGKTGQRTIRLIFCTSSLATWIESHPFKLDKDSVLFVNYGSRNHGKVMAYPGARKILDSLYVKAGIKKRSNPHLIRHSRASSLAAKAVLGEFQMNQFFGWVQGGKMAGRYLHLNCASTEESLLNFYGVKKDLSHKESELKPKDCPRCKTLNPVTGTFCHRCGGILDADTALLMQETQQVELSKRSEADILMEAIFKNPEFKKRVFSAMGSVLGKEVV